MTMKTMQLVLGLFAASLLLAGLGHPAYAYDHSSRGYHQPGHHGVHRGRNSHYSHYSRRVYYSPSPHHGYYSSHPHRGYYSPSPHHGHGGHHRSVGIFIHR